LLIIIQDGFGNGYDFILLLLIENAYFMINDLEEDLFNLIFHRGYHDNFFDDRHFIFILRIDSRICEPRSEGLVHSGLIRPISD